MGRAVRDRGSARASVLATGLLAALAGCAPADRAGGAPVSVAETLRVGSNVFRSDYAGSEKCRPCHTAIYKAWKTSPMRQMTRRAAEAHIEAPFDGARFSLKGDSIDMESMGGRRFMRISSGKYGNRLYRITRVIGGRYREDFAGIDVTDDADPVTGGGKGADKVLPASFVFSSRSWRYKGYSVMVRERPGLRAGPVWASTCIGCHNTLPYATLLYDDLLGSGAPGYQGKVPDSLLPWSRTWRVVAADDGGLGRALADEIAFLGAARLDPGGASLPELLVQASTAMRSRLDERHLVEIGIGCEACHNGAREHVDNPDLLPAFEVKSPLLSMEPRSGAPTRARWINKTCARCHTVLFSSYPWTWEGGRRADPVPGGSSTNSGEARDFLLGGCSSQLSCVACHDPHAKDHPDGVRAIEGAAGNRLCTSCHRELATGEAARAHTHHDPDGPGGSCVGCHMPKKNMGLGYGLTRYHRIGSPTDEERVLRDRPLECALCHGERSVEDLVSRMERWWGKRYDRQPLRELYGEDLDVNVLASTLARGKPHEQAVAIAVLGDAGNSAVVPRLASHLAHEYPLVRYYAKEAIESLIGQPLPVDVNEPAGKVAAEAQRWLVDRMSTSGSR
jgi:predicted CXXCH cytochrome family protein